MHPAAGTANKPPLSRKRYLIAPILLNCFGLELLVRLTNEVGKGEVDHFITAAVEHRFESPKIKADRLVELSVAFIKRVAGRCSQSPWLL